MARMMMSVVIRPSTTPATTGSSPLLPSRCSSSSSSCLTQKKKKNNNKNTKNRGVRAAAKSSSSDGGEEQAKSKSKSKQSLFTSLTDALDFAQVRSEKDEELLEEARENTQSGGRMSREQYGALRRKIGGTYKDFFKSYVEVEGEYVEEGWVDKTCKICKKDTRGDARQVDKLGRYVHVACLDSAAAGGGNFFTRLFSRS